MVTITFDPIETQKKEQREALETGLPQRTPQALYPRRNSVQWASVAKKFGALVARLVTLDRRQGKIEMGV